MSNKANDIKREDIRGRKAKRRNAMRKRKARKRFLLIMVLISICIAGITTILGNLNKNTPGVNAETIEEKNKELDGVKDKGKDESLNENKDYMDNSEKFALDNSGYLPLENDKNADDVSVVLPETMYNWNFYREDGKKVAYLTFDDGPSTEITPEILDILDANDVKATFFVVGTAIEGNPKAGEILKRMAKDGHAIANHGYSHNYNILYPNGVIDVDAFMNDMDKNLQLLKGILGKDFDTRLLRMPGGYGTWYGVTPLNVALKEKGYYQTDWNSLNGDAEGSPKNAQEMLNRLKETMLDYDTLIVLMHDTNDKKATAEYLQSAIDHLKSQGFEFRTLK